MKQKYFVTLAYYAIRSAKTIEVEGSLLAAKRAGTREFGDQRLEYKIVIKDANDRIVSQRNAGAQKG